MAASIEVDPEPLSELAIVDAVVVHGNIVTGVTDGLVVTVAVVGARDVAEVGAVVVPTATTVGCAVGGIVAHGGVPDPPTQKRVGVKLLGFCVGVAAATPTTAAAASTLPLTQSVPVPAILSAVEYNRLIIACGVVPREVDAISAATPATTGVAIEVPER